MSKDVETKPETKSEVKSEVLESEKILQQIDALKSGNTPPVIETSKSVAKDKIEEKPTESSTTTPEKVPQPTVEKQSTPEKGQAESTETPTNKKEGKPDVDIREWAKRKRINADDTDSVLKAYREMERKLSQMNSAKGQSEGNVPPNVPRGTNEPQVNPNGYQPTPNWQPPQYPPWQPTYQSPPPYIDRRAIIEQEAQRFNMTPEDLERLLPLVNEVTELKLNRTQAMLQAKYDAQLADLTRGNKRNAEFNELMADPLFTTPEVAFEIDQIMSENPQRLKLEPTPWTNMFKDALERIARKNLQGKTTDVEETSTLPTTPPKAGGKGSSPVIPTSNTPGALLEKFKTLDTAEMEKQLASIGAIPPR